MTSLTKLPRSNPFSSRFVRPGAIPYLFPAGEDVTVLCHRLEAQGWWGEIIGPHGSGKSTLLAALVPELSRWGQVLLQVRLCQEQRPLPESIWPQLAEPGRRLLVVDGFEQAGWWTRRRLQRACRRGGHGLLITAHRSLGLPRLYRTATTPETARLLVSHLLGQHPCAPDIDYCDLLKRHRGSFRHVLFELYDRYEEGLLLASCTRPGDNCNTGVSDA
jgi:hypothetical protein